MQSKARFETSARTLLMVMAVSLSLGGCAYIEQQLREQESVKSPEVRPVRVARAEPNVMRSAPRSSRDEAGAAHSDRSRAAAPQMAAPSGAVRSPAAPAEPRETAPVPSAAPPRPAAPSSSPEVAPPPQQPQPRIINPAAPPAPPPAQEAPAAPRSAPPADPLPTQPAPPPPRPDAVPAPPNRANVTPPRHAGGGVPSVRAPAEEETAKSREFAALPPPRTSTPPPGTPGVNGIELAHLLLTRGKVLEARAHLQAAVRVSPALALLELARTYDPFYLGMLPSIDDGSEPRRAAALYQEAILHGSPTAGTDLDRLRQMHPGLR